MQNPNPNICPRQLHICSFAAPNTPTAGVDNRKRKRHSVELSRLLQEMVVVIGLPANGSRDFGVDLFHRGVGVHGDLVLLEGGDAGRVHPGFDDEGPAIEGDDGGEETRRLDGG